MIYDLNIINIFRPLFFLVFVCNLTFSQTQEVILPSPETEALFRYQDYPMDYSTGLPQISIPLFTVKNGGLSVPISISYHASGFRVTDVDGPIAAGWSLNIGGMVSRTIHGDPDFGEFPFPDSFDPYLDSSNQNILKTLEQVTHYSDNPDLVLPGEFKDSQYDIFSYTFGQHSGKFIFKDSAGIKTPVLLSQKPLKIFPTTDTTGLNSLRITNDKGDNYTFVGQESQTTRTLNYTGFSIKKIVSANQKDTISYTYGGAEKQYRRFISQYEILQDEWYDYPDQTEYDNPNGRTFEDINAQNYDINRIKKIDFRQGTLEFVLKGGAGMDKDLIDYIQIKNRNGRVLRIIKFKREPLHAIRAVLGVTNLITHKLTGIEIQDQNGGIVQNYAFDHYPTVYIEGNSKNKIIDSRFIDFWGYYNASGMTDMLPLNRVSSSIHYVTEIIGDYFEVGNPQARRNPYLPGLMSGVLKKIHYPTGGSTKFVYNHNKYRDSETGMLKNGPGLRVKEIINSDGHGKTAKRSFLYSNLASMITDCGELDIEPKLEYMFTEQYYWNFRREEYIYRERIFHSGFLPNLAELASRPIRYAYVTEYKGSISDNNGKTVYNYDNYRWIAYPLPITKTHSINRFHIYQYKYWDTPVLINQTDFKAVKNDNGLVIGYDEIRKVTNNYNSITNYEVLGLHVKRNVNFPDPELLGIPGNPLLDPIYTEEFFYKYANFGYPVVYSYGHYSIPIGTKNLMQTTEKLTNDDSSTFSTTTSYSYNDNNLVSQVVTTTSRIDSNTLENRVFKKDITYPSDYSSSTLMDMVSHNMVNFMVEEKNYLEGKPISGTRINYMDWNNHPDTVNFRPKFIETSKGSNSLTTGIIYHSYDEVGNLEEISKKDAPHTFYIWGYNESQPIAKINNFTAAEALSIQALINTAKTASDNDDDNCKALNCKEQELREALKAIQDNSILMGAKMTYFTYDPLIGATSVTDPRGYIIYYEYDAFNRLKAVKDAEGNLVSDYDYSYKKLISN